MIKDRALKATALQYLVSKRAFPQLEVVVYPQLVTGSGGSRKAPPLTDVDVLGLIPDDFEAHRSILIDCRTLKNQSPIARAFWLRGLMDELNAKRGLCVLRGEKVEPDHRISAARLEVLLVTEEEFESYIGATGGKASGIPAHAASIELWESFLDIRSKCAALAEAIDFSTSYFGKPTMAASAARRTLAVLRRLRGELDPAKPHHVTIVANMAALFLISMADIVMKVFTSYLQPKVMHELSDALLMILYGGKETYDSLNAMRRLVKISGEPEDLSLPEWDRFVQFVRETLESPIELSRAPLILREVAWAHLSTAPDYGFASTLAAESPRSAKYALLGTEYLCRATKLPPEFGTQIADRLLAVQKTPA
ncbi:MAG: hypothetical protein ABSH28_10795 [Acidobacteriota bacterium]|jgi:hypothetical protein